MPLLLKTPEKKHYLNIYCVSGTWTCSNSFNPCPLHERNGLIVTSCLLTRKLRHGDTRWLLQYHTATSAGFEPRSLIPKPFSFHELRCISCLQTSSVSPLPQGARSSCTWGQWSMAPSWLGPASPLWAPLLVSVSKSSVSLFLHDLIRQAPALRPSSRHLPQSGSRVHV